MQLRGHLDSISFDESEASRSHIIEMPAPMLMNARAHCRNHAYAHLQEGCGLGQHRERDDANVQFSPISRQRSPQSAMQRSDSRENVTINHGHREEEEKNTACYDRDRRRQRAACI